MRWPTLAVVVLAVTAGCGGFVGESSERTVTPAPVPEPTAQTATENAIAPGLGGGQVINPERLARAHEAAIRNQSYGWTERLRSTKFGENRSLVVTSRLRAENERLYRFELSTSWSFANTSEYAAGPVRYRREVSRSGFRYRTAPPTNVTTRFGERSLESIRRYLSIGAATVAATRVDGQRYYRVTGTTESIPVTGDISNYSVEALVAPSGFVRSLTVRYDDLIGSDRQQIRYQFRYTNVGETRVERPEWVTQRWPDNSTTNATETP